MLSAATTYKEDLFLLVRQNSEKLEMLSSKAHVEPEITVVGKKGRKVSIATVSKTGCRFKKSQPLIPPTFLFVEKWRK